MKKLISIVAFSTLLGLAGAMNFNKIQVFAQDKVFTTEELSQYNGKNGNKSYTAYEGVVYDVTDSKLWKLGEHFGLQAGKDLTADMAEAPHGDEVFAGFKVVGSLEMTDENQPSAQPEKSALTDTQNQTEPKNLSATDKWWSKRIKIMGMSILGWTGLLMGIFFILTFATCFAMPWAKLPLPWKGSKPGADPLDNAPRHMPWSSVHKYFVWWTVILGVIHGVLGFMQMLGIYL